MIYNCKYCGSEMTTLDACPSCRVKLKLIRDIKAMLLPTYERKKAKEREVMDGYDKDVHEH